MSQVIYLTDLDKCRPQSALSPERKWHCWRTLPYETDSLSGTMLLAGEETGAQEVTYPLRVNGWHAIYIGIYREPHGGNTYVQVKLTGDPAFTPLTLPAGPRCIEDLYWKAADLSNQEIAFGQLCGRVSNVEEPGAYRCEKARVAYIKLVPLAVEEVGALQADRQRTDTRRLFTHYDAFYFPYAYRISTPEEVYYWIEPYRDTDFARIYWEAGAGDVMNYFSQVGRVPTCADVGDYDRTGDRLHAESYRIFQGKGLDPFKLALDYTHEIGLEFHASYRTAGFYYPPPEQDHWNRGGIYERHPELRAVARDGSQAPRISYTFPETRRFVVSLLREMAKNPIDGVCLLYNRRPPLVEYEPPLVEGFLAEYGEDPRKLDEKDPRWLSYRCRILTQFMLEVRQEMDAVAREQGRARRIEVSAVVSNEQENLVNGIDLKAWVAEGLVDTLIPYTSAPRLNSNVDSWADVQDVAYWVSLTKGTSCKLALNILPRNRTSEEYLRKATELYEAGVGHLFFWDCSGSFGRGWNALRRLGHREEVEAWVRDGEPSIEPPRQVLRSLGGWNMTYDTPG